MNWLARLAVAARARPFVTCSFLLAVTGLAALVLPHVRFESDLTALFPEGDETVRLYRQVGTHEAGTRTLLVVLRGDAIDAALPGIVESLRGSPFLESVTATREELIGANAKLFRASPAWFLPDATLDRLVARMNGDGAARAIGDAKARLATDPIAGRDLLLKDPLGLRWILEEGARNAAPLALDPGSPYLVTSGGKTALLKLVGKKEPLDVDFSKALLQDVESRLDGRTFDVIGGYVVAREEEARVRGDMQKSSAWSFALVAAFLLVSYRSLARPLALILSVNFIVFWTLAFGGVLFGPLTPLAAGSAAILVGLGVDPGIHLLARYEAERIRTPAAEALRAAVKSTARPIVLAAATMSAAFLTLAVSDFRGLRGFGLLLALGLFFMLVNTFTVHPVWLRGRFEREPRIPRSFVVDALSRLHRSRFRTTAAAVLFGAAIVGWALVFGRGVPINLGPDSLRPATNAMDAARRRLEDEIGVSPVPVSALVPRSRPLAEVAAGAERLQAKGLVRATLGAHLAVPTPAKTARADRFRAATATWIETALAELERAGFERAPFRPGLEEMDRALRSADVVPPPEEDFLASPRGEMRVLHLFLPRTIERPAERAKFAADVAAELGGDVMVASPYSLGDLLRETFERELERLIAFSTLAVVVLVLLGSGGLRGGLLTLVPAATGFGLALGQLALFERSINLGNFVALPLLAGICMDNGIHMVAVKHEGDEDPFGTAGVALWRNYATTALGFGALIVADTPGLVSLGVTLLIGCTTAFLVSLIVLAPKRRALSESHP